MAGKGGESAASLFIRLGLDMSGLNSDFIVAEQTVQQNLSRLNRANNIIELKAQVEIAGLDAVKDKEKILEIQTRALNEQLKLQKERLMLAEAAFNSVKNAQGATSAGAQKLEIAMERERLKVAQLEKSLRDLSKANTQAQPQNLTNKFENLLSNSLGKLPGNLGAVVTSFLQTKEAISSTMEAMGKFPAPVAKVVAGLAVLPTAAIAAEMALIKLAESTIAAGDSFYVMSRGFQMGIADTGKFVTACQVAGVEVNDLAQTVKRVVTESLRGGKNSASLKMLEKYGANLRDENGNLKNLFDSTTEISNALNKAREMGDGFEFVRTVLKRASADSITALEDWSGVLEQAGGLVKNGLADPKFAHEVQGNLNALNVQMKAFKAGMGYVLLPAANDAILELTDVFGKLTSAVKDNKENILFWGAALKAPIKTLNDLTDSVLNFSTALEKGKEEGGVFGKILDSLAKRRDDIKDLLEVAPAAGFFTLATGGIGADFFAKKYQKSIEKLHHEQLAEQYAREIKAKREEENAAREKNKLKELAEFHGLDVSNFEDLDAIEKAIDAANERIAKNEADTAATIYHMQHNEYENRLYDLNRFLKESFENENVTEDEKFSLIELAQAKREEIERQREEHERQTEEKIQQIRDAANAKFKTDLENQIDAIEKSRDAWMEAGMDEAEATELAEKQKAEAIKNLEESFANSVKQIHQNALENRLSQIEEEKKAWIQKGIDEVKATKQAEEEKAKARQNAALSVLKSQLEEYHAYKEGGYIGLFNYQRNKLFEQGIKPSDLNITAKQLEEFLHAQQVVQSNLLPNLASAQDRAEDYELWNAQFNEERQRQKDEWQRILDGIKIGSDMPVDNQLSEITPQFEETSNALEDFNAALQDNQLSDINTQISEISQGLATFGEALNSITIPAQSQSEITPSTNAPADVTVNVSINEAHAWDSEHISELADKVADKITPELTNAIGGDSNSY